LPAELVSNPMIKTANIAGAGIGGLTAAIALAQRGVGVRVFEQAAELGEVGAGLQLSPNAMKVLRELGLVTVLRDVAFEPEFATIKDGKTAQDFVSVPLKEAAEARFGAPYLHVHRADLHQILLAEARRLGVDFELNTQLNGYDDAGFLGAVSADLNIAADGVRSCHATQMNKGQDPQFTGQVAWRGAVDADALPSGLISPNATVWTGLGKHIVTYYVRGGSLVNFVAVEERDSWTDPSWTQQGDIAELRAAFTGWHPTIETLLNAVEVANIWALYDKPVLDRWSDGSVVLLGDACHPTLPFLAQGAAMAIEDASVLALCLHEEPQVPDALRRYEMARKPRTAVLQKKARANADMFHNRGALGGVLSKAKLQVARRLPPTLAMKPFNGIYAYDATVLPR
jgi:salicylate hydroxylase